jgi:hypothetical protein
MAFASRSGTPDPMQGQLPNNYAALRVTEILYAAAFWQRSAAAPGWITMIMSSDLLAILQS